MQKTSSVQGMITDSSGKPVADAIVMVTAGDFEVNDIASVSNDDGQFFLNNLVVPGNYTLQIHYQNASVEHHVAVQDPNATLRVRL